MDDQRELCIQETDLRMDSHNIILLTKFTLCLRKMNGTVM